MWYTVSENDPHVCTYLLFFIYNKVIPALTEKRGSVTQVVLCVTAVSRSSSMLSLPNKCKVLDADEDPKSVSAATHR